MINGFDRQPEFLKFYFQTAMYIDKIQVHGNQVKDQT